MVPVGMLLSKTRQGESYGFNSLDTHRSDTRQHPMVTQTAREDLAPQSVHVPCAPPLLVCHEGTAIYL